MCSPEYQLATPSGAGMRLVFKGTVPSFQDFRRRAGGDPIQISTSAPGRSIGPQASCNGPSMELAAFDQLINASVTPISASAAKAPTPKAKPKLRPAFSGGTTTGGRDSGTPGGSGRSTKH